MKNIWTHKKYPGKKFEMKKIWALGFGWYVHLVYQGPRGGVISDEYKSHQDAKAAGWVKVK